MEIKNWINTQLARDIWEKKYQNNGETFDEWLIRISGGNEEVKKAIIGQKFLFGGRILSNRGLGADRINKKGEKIKARKITYSNCYVLAPPEDSLKSIYDTDEKLATTFSYGGGVGIDLSKLRPRGAEVNNAAKTTSGPVSFMELYSNTTRIIGQDGRRGALMLSLDCSHPDIEEFIDVKKDLNKVTKANISVKVTNEFMNAVICGTDYSLEFYLEDGTKIEKIVDAKRIFKRLCENNWEMAEPGILFWDAIKNYNLLSEYENFIFAGVNPCAEEPLPAGGSCLLGSINLVKFVDKNGDFDFDDFAYTVGVGVIALNEVLDEGLNLHPLQAQRDSVRDWRQIGLGIMGLGDMLIKMGITYGSLEALQTCEKIGREMINSALKASSLLAGIDGSFPEYDYEKTVNSEFFKVVADEDTKLLIEKYGLRNSQLLTVAPTGTLSTMLGISGGIEPIFANSYTRKTESLHGEDVYYKVYTPIVEEYMKENGIEDEKDLPEYFITAQNLDFLNRIYMQSSWQKYIDASISSTINVPEDFSKEQVEKLYKEAWLSGLKGCTIYRDNCNREGVLTTGAAKEEDKIEIQPTIEATLGRGDIIKVSDDCIGRKRTLKSGCGTLHCEAFFDSNTGQLLETYFSKGSTGGCNNFMIGLSRMISLAARGGVSIENISDQLNSCGTCPSYAVRRATKGDVSKGSSCPVAIGYALEEMYNEVQDTISCERELMDKINDSIGPKISEEDFYELVELAESASKTEIKSKEKKDSKYLCPDCGADLESSGGCIQCKSCGWSKCS